MKHRCLLINCYSKLNFSRESDVPRVDLLEILHHGIKNSHNHHMSYFWILDNFPPHVFIIPHLIKTRNIIIPY